MIHKKPILAERDGLVINKKCLKVNQMLLTFLTLIKSLSQPIHSRKVSTNAI